MVPYLLPQSKDSFKARWKMSLWVDEDRERFLKLTEAMPLAAHAVVCKEKGKNTSPAVWTSKIILQKFLDEAADSLVRYSYKSFEEKRGQGFVAESFDDAWHTRLIKSLSDSDSHFHIKGFRERYIPQLLNRWLKPVIVSHQWEDYKICFRLEIPFGPLKDGGKWRISYLLQAVDDPSLLVPSEKVWRSSKRELRFLNRTFKEPQEKLLMGFLCEDECQ